MLSAEHAPRPTACTQWTSAALTPAGNGSGYKRGLHSLYSLNRRHSGRHPVCKSLWLPAPPYLSTTRHQHQEERGPPRRMGPPSVTFKHATTNRDFEMCTHAKSPNSLDDCVKMPMLSSSSFCSRVPSLCFFFSFAPRMAQEFLLGCWLWTSSPFPSCIIWCLNLGLCIFPPGLGALVHA